MAGKRRVRRYRFQQLDVFTSRLLEGNPLAVFTDARGLSPADMQAVAREMNLSETTFVFPRPAQVERKRGVRVRIFTTQEELPFAGHPTLGTALVLRGASPANRKWRPGARSAPDSLSLELGVGRITVSFRQEPDGKVFGEMRQLDPEFGALHIPAEVAAVAGLKAGAVASSPPIQTVSTGVPFVIVPLVSLEAIRAVHLDWEKAQAYSKQHNGALSFYFITGKTVDASARLHARMIFSHGEDPATGSAAGCAAAWMVRYGVANPEERVIIEQGLEIKRPSHIYVRAGVDPELKPGVEPTEAIEQLRAGKARVVNVRVGGHAVEVLQGELKL